MNKSNLIFGTLVLVLSVGASVLLGGHTIEKTTVTEKAGALSSPDIQSPYLSFGGVRRWAGWANFSAATTTPCSIQSPAATSTLVTASWQITTGTSTAATIDLGTSTTRYSTTTNLVAAKSVGSGARGDANWTSAGGGVNDNVMSPSTWVVVKTAGAGLGGYTYSGRCAAVFQEL